MRIVKWLEDAGATSGRSEQGFFAATNRMVCDNIIAMK